MQFSSIRCGRGLQLGPERLTVIGLNPSGWIGVQSNQSVSALHVERYYFEVTLHTQSAPNEFSINFTLESYDLREPNIVVWRNNGYIFVPAYSDEFNSTYQTGDTVGLGVDFTLDLLFFTEEAQS